jgi:hypothetical protein
VADIEDARVAPGPLPRKLLGGFKILSRRIHFLGVCTSCQARA